MRLSFTALIVLLIFLFPGTYPSLSAQERMYWANNAIGILSANKDGTDLDTLVRSDIVGFTSISIDSLNQKVYWIDNSRKQFGRMNYDGSERELVFKVEDQSPNYLFIEPVEHKLYWFDQTSATFWKANMDGSQREFVVEALPGAYTPEYIVDKTNELIYWRNVSANKIQSINLIDQTVQDVVISHPDTAIIEFRIDVINDKIYWLNFEFENLFKEIRRMDLDGSEEEIIFSFQYDSYDLRQEFEIDPINDKLVVTHQPTYNSVEYVLIGNLDGTNLNQHGFILTKGNRDFNFDGNTNDLFYVGSNPYGIHRYHMEGSSSSVTRLTQDAIFSAKGIAVDHHSEKIYWTDGANDKIKRSNLDGSAVEILLQNAFLVNRLSDPGAIALDVAGNYMYWVDRGKGEINRARLDGSMYEVVLSNLFNPEGLALDTANQAMYFTLQGVTGIYKANMDGSGLEQLVSVDGGESGFPDQLALDLENEHIYWSSNKLGIARVNLDGTNVDTILATTYGKDSGLALDIDNEKIYWIIDSTLQRINFDGTGKIGVITGLTIPASFGGYLTFNDTHAYQAVLDSGSVCEEDDLVLSGMVSNNTLEWAGSTLSSTAIIPDRKTVHYKAGNSIRLLPGFSAQSGSEFKAKIEACANMRIAPPPESENPVADVHSGLGLRLFPNPVDERTTISWVLNSECEVDIQLYSISGKPIRSLARQAFHEGQHLLDIDLGDLASGMYILVVRAGDLFRVKKFVVN